MRSVIQENKSSHRIAMHRTTRATENNREEMPGDFRKAMKILKTN